MSDDLRQRAEALAVTLSRNRSTFDFMTATTRLLVAFAAEVSRAERERCAKVCRRVSKDYATVWTQPERAYKQGAADSCAEAIERISDDPIQAHSKPAGKQG